MRDLFFSIARGFILYGAMDNWAHGWKTWALVGFCGFAYAGEIWGTANARRTAQEHTPRRKNDSLYP